MGRVVVVVVAAVAVAAAAAVGVGDVCARAHPVAMAIPAE